MMMCKKNKNVAKWGKLLVALAPLVTFAVPLWAQDWGWLFNTADGDDFYLDQSSVEDHGSYVIGWVKNVYSDESARNTGVAYDLTLWGAAKGTKQTRRFQTTIYLKNGKNATISAQLLEGWGLGQWEYCIPGTTGEAIWEALMSAAGIRY